METLKFGYCVTTKPKNPRIYADLHINSRYLRLSIHAVRGLYHRNNTVNRNEKSNLYDKDGNVLKELEGEKKSIKKHPKSKDHHIF